MQVEIEDLSVDLIEKHFPKGKSKERGEAMVLASELLIGLSEVIGKAEDYALARTIARIKKYMDKHDKADSSFSTDSLLVYLMKDKP